MKTRIISGCVLLPLFALVYFGGLWLDLAVFAITLIAVDEMIRGFENCGIKPNKYVCFASAVLIAAMEPLSENLKGVHDSPLVFCMLWLILVITLALIYGFKIDNIQLNDVMATVFASIYPTFFFHFVTMINNSAFSHMIWFVFLAAFGADIFAYFTGMAIGRHKLCPILSPKKTIEGAVGGVFGSVVLCLLFGTLVLDKYVSGGGTYLMTGHYVIIGIIGSVAAQLGDLSASSLKRRMGIKDYGKLIPGHGGIMDRFDSVLFTAPFIYIYGYIAVYMLAKG